ncbi:MAG: 3-hydroxyacyl-[acyl-carrier protein] dehydratase / trans-2-decenoyl-[acyl-carrier protein] isomerase [Pseudomonadota bacterium]|nr:3-hydroxyacyl-[acyl-carrier protein] dehydratase / trans-2-decenoyl-[acyl-carrier protein] isomerase [Pseudomonadota bacterium]
MNKSSSYTYQELLACARGELFGPGIAQLPSPNMLMMNRIIYISSEGGHYGKGEVIAELDIHPDLWFFSCHFIGDPVMPGCLGLEGMLQLTGFFLGWLGLPGRGRALGCGQVKFMDQVRPDAQKLTYRLHIKRVILRQLVIGVADAALEVDGRTIYLGHNLRVGLFTATDHF